MISKDNTYYEDKESFSPWEVYSDLYCGLLLVFVLLFFFSIYQYIVAMETNNADTEALQAALMEEQKATLAIYKADMEDQEAALAERSSQVEKQQTALAIALADIEDRENEVARQEQELSTLQAQLDAQSEQLATQEEELNNQALVLEQQQQQIEEQETLLASREEELGQQTELLGQQATLIEEQQNQLDQQAFQIEEIIGVRQQLIVELNQQLKANNIQAQVDMTTGAIILEGSVLFDLNSTDLSESGKVFLRTFLPVYLDVLLQPEFKDYLAEIVIEGHTDNQGPYMLNLGLSERRALAVAEFCMDENGGFLNGTALQELRSFLSINGCSYRDLIYNADGSVNAEQSRRVEIKFRLKDQEMIEALDEILNQ